MTDKTIQGIIHIKSVSKKKVTIDRIRTHLLRTDDDSNDVWSIEKLESMLTDLINQNIIELIGDTYKIKQTRNTQVESMTMMVPETQNNTHITSCTIPETQKSPELTSAKFQETQKTPDSSLEAPHTPKRPLKPIEKDTTHNFTSFQNIFKKELEAIKDFTKPVERKFEELEKAIIGLSEPEVSNYNESSSLTVELLKNRVSTLEKLFIEKNAIINFLLKQNKENHESSLTKADSTKIKQSVSEQLQQPLEKKNGSPIKKKKENHTNGRPCVKQYI